MRGNSSQVSFGTYWRAPAQSEWWRMSQMDQAAESAERWGFRVAFLSLSERFWEAFVEILC